MNNSAMAKRDGLNLPDLSFARNINLPRIAPGNQTARGPYSGYCYDLTDGHYIGTFGARPGQNVYAGNAKYDFTDLQGGESTHVENIVKLNIISHTSFVEWASTVYGESSFWKMNDAQELYYEMSAIAYIHWYRNKTAYGKNSQAAIAFRATKASRRTGKMQLANLAMINAILPNSPDNSNGANMWDGQEQSFYPETELRGSVPTSDKPGNKKTFELHMNTMGWSITDEHYEKWKKNVGAKFKVPQLRVSPDNYPNKTPNKGKIRLYSTAVYGATIFWREAK